MRNNIKKITVVVFIIVLSIVAYQFFAKRDELGSKIEPKRPNEIILINKLLSSWTATQGKFASKAGESGTYNKPSRIQFISDTVLLVYYDDGLNDPVSLLQFKNDGFTELMTVGMGRMSVSKWQELVMAYGKKDYQITDYDINNSGITRVNENVFIK